MLSAATSAVALTSNLMPCEMITGLLSFPNCLGGRACRPRLTHRLLLELPQSDNQQQQVEQKQRNEYNFY